MEKFLKISNPTAPGGYQFFNLGLLMDCTMGGGTALLMKSVNKSGQLAIYFAGRTADVTGATTTFAPSPNTSNLLIDSSATFITDGVKKGDLVEGLGPYTTVVSVDSETQITLADYNIGTSAQNYSIWSDFNAPATFMQNAIVKALQSKWTEPIYEVNDFPFTITP